jgi:16S rRNA (cytosine1402-N4)-methyltransferase
VTFHHIPVLLEETIAALAPRDGELFIDSTLGGGGHTEALLKAADVRVIGIDRDPAAIAAATERLAPFGDRFTALHGSFDQLSRLIQPLGIEAVDGVLADFGVSSPQLDQGERGFSFRLAGPLDMRMDPSRGMTAADLVNGASEQELGEILRDYGEEHEWKRVAKAIVAARPHSDTLGLAEVITKALGPAARRFKINPATRSFQGLRIAVNDELGQIERWLPQAVDLLRPTGRIAVITFHSLEDRLVKQFFAQRAGKGLPKDAWGNLLGVVDVRPLPSVVPPRDDTNPRARSARLRPAVRLSWPVS